MYLEEDFYENCIFLLMILTKMGKKKVLKPPMMAFFSYQLSSTPNPLSQAKPALKCCQSLEQKLC